MRKVYILFLFFTLFSCRNETKITPIVAEPKYSKPLNHKFVFVGVKVKEPHLNYTEGFEENAIPERYSITWIEYYYFSEIQEIPDFTEDIEYKMMDSYENLIKSKLGFEYRLDLSTKIKNSETRDLLLSSKASIQDRTVESFDTYKQASKSRRLMIRMWDDYKADLISGVQKLEK